MPAPSIPPRPARFADLVGVAACSTAAVAGLVVFRGAIGYFFAQDDFLGLARASGLAPRLTGPWRFLSHQAVFDCMLPLAGLHAGAYHAVSLLVHVACAALLAALLMRWLSIPAALMGAVFFAAHPTSFDAVYWFSAIGDSLALLFALIALLLALRSGRSRWLALPACALSLLAKESTVALPLIAALAMRFDRRRRGRPAPPMARLTLGLAAIALADLVAFAVGNAFGVREGLATAAPYAFGIGAHIGANLLTYLGWSATFLRPFVLGFNDAVDPIVYPWAFGVLVLWSIGLASRRMRRAGWVVGGAMWLAFLVPVLGLRNHTYHYYLYAPLAGAAWCVAAVMERLLPGGRPGVAIAGAAAALLTLNGALTVRRIETAPFVLAELRASSIVDRSRIASHVGQSLTAARLPPGVTLLFWSPIASSLGPSGESLAEPAPNETYWERNVRDALVDGLAVRVMFPQVRQVRFVRAFAPAPADWRYAVYRPDGRLGVATPTALDSIIRSAEASH